MNTSLIVIQPTPYCNIDCKYCYLPLRNDRTALDADRVGLIFEKALRFPTVSEQVTIVWHAGEPLVLGPGFYEAAFARIQEVCPPTLRVDHAIQTNGMLINDHWCDLFKRWDVGVGVSVDGPKHIHDAMRQTRTGKGTFDKTIAGMRSLQRRGIHFYVISVLTKQSLLEPEAMFDFYQQFDIRDVGFNIEEEEGIHSTSTLNEGAIDGLFSEFLARFTSEMKQRNFPIAVRELEEALLSVRFLQSQPLANNQVVPFGVVTIDVHGNVYTFSPELAGYSVNEFSTFSIGNILTSTFDEMRHSSILRELEDQISRGTEICRRDCQYFRVCGGGAPSNKLFENNTFASGETMHCRLSKKRVTDFVLSEIEARSPKPALGANG